jgi:hypothetical protein
MVHQVLCLNMELEPASVTQCFLRKLDDGQSPKEEDCVVNFTCALFCLLDLFDTCPETSVRSVHSTSHNISEECRSHKTVWFGCVWSDSERSGLALHVQI